ncbi:MAG: hypothetical protein U0Z26_09225 [Anaerolineales bacterium]
MQSLKKVFNSPSSFALVIVAIITLIGAYIQSKSSKDVAILEIEATSTAEARLTQSAALQPTATFLPPRLIFTDSFDNNLKDWKIGNDDSPTEYILSRYISDGKYHRIENSTDAADGAFGSVSIPEINEKNFCLFVDVHGVDFSPNTDIVIVFRAYKYTLDDNEDSAYYIEFFENGTASIFRDPQGINNSSQIGAIEKGILWSDKNNHTIKISLQDNFLEVYDGQSNQLLYQTVLNDSGTLAEKGEIRLGSGVTAPNQTIHIEFDNVKVYDRCPN